MHTKARPSSLRYAALIIMCLTTLWACKGKNYSLKTGTTELPDYVYRATPYPQQLGDPDSGYHYMIYGGYVGNGVPYEVFSKFLKKNPDTVLKRTGVNADLDYGYTAFALEDGRKVVSGNCFTCHASPLMGEVVLGLGNSLGDFTQNTSFQISLLNTLVKTRYGKDSPEWLTYEEHAAWLASVAPAIVMNNPGINPAFRLEEALIKLRNPEDLTYTDTPRFELPEVPIGTDVPPLWNIRKKQVLYYNGMGRGDFSKLIMQACLLGIHDSTAARKIHDDFGDALAWMMELEPPAYPGPVNATLASKGRHIFEAQCSKCHGKYGKRETYPNKIVPVREVQTDSLYALYALQSPVNEWYNSSWFHNSPPYAESKPSYGYIAPPLDGVWATAPYLHNGSVPTLADLLNSAQRPTYWKRSMDHMDYDFQNVGWKYEKKGKGDGKKTFDTTLPGYGNQGHFYGDTLNPDERSALIEYLKTL